MIRARVVGKVWSSRCVESMPGGAMVEVKTDDGAHIVAFDPLGCDVDECVLVTQGSVAAAYFEQVATPVDALIVGSVDESK